MLTLALAVSSIALGAPQTWKPAPSPLMTTWGETVTPENAWRQYPRPTLVREAWVNLNGLWDYAVTKGESPAKMDGSILVPFPLESALSGVGRPLEDDETLWYRRSIDVPREWNGKRVVLHIGAADWSAAVIVNGKEVGTHTGGYTPFSFDITDALKAEGNEVMIRVKDPTDSGGQPRGKQWSKPHGIWYTRTSGIWQTVWMEPVATNSIQSVRFESSLKDGSVACDVEISQPSEDMICELTVAGEKVSVPANAKHVRPQIKLAPHVWTPDDPFLYDAKVTLHLGKGTVDSVGSYFAFREISVGKDEAGVNRLMLNGKPVFQFGPLDQGFWPDGLYTPPNEAAMKFDIEAAKKMGCNMLRKHVKVESDRYYYWCDKMGMMVWQDIPSPFFASKDFDKAPQQTEEWRRNFEKEAAEIVSSFNNHPSIVMWVPWNEGWGQNDLAWSRSVVQMVKKQDPSRLVNNASGWTDMKVGDTSDVHAYPHPGMPPLEEKRASVLGEFGGLGLPLEGHTWQKKDNWGYQTYKNEKELTAAYIGLMKELPALISQGLCAAVYTQTTDVEIECNGWLTYDRKVWKIDPAAVKDAMKGIHGPVMTIKQLVQSAAQLPAGKRPVWKYTFEQPAAGWEKPDFNAAGWREGQAGFGTEGTPGAIVGTVWSTKDIWMRRSFSLIGTPLGPVQLSLYHDEDAEVYINGVLAAKVDGYRNSYGLVPISDEAQASIKDGVNTIAIHCKQTSGGQGIDAGLVMMVEPKK